MSEKILAINPGSTSTKIAYYIGEAQQWAQSISHSAQELKKYVTINDQFTMRREFICEALKEHGIQASELDAVVARGGLLPPVQSGAYAVNEAMLDTLHNRPRNEHASNLGAALARDIAGGDIPSYIYDPVTVDEMIPLVRVTGMKEIQRMGMGHNLNMRAAAIKYAKLTGVPYESLNIIVAHLGGGITLSLHSKGRIIDMISDEEGPFSPERSGGLPIFQLIDMAFSGEYDKVSLMKKIQRNSGLMAYFGTSDARDVQKLIDEGNEEAALVYEALALNVAKFIAKLSVTVSGNVDAIVLTGGMAFSKLLTGWIIERVKFIAPVRVIAGENEMQSLALGALRVLRGEEHVHEFILPEVDK